MKNKLKFLIGQSIKKKTNTKWFKFVNLILLVLIIGVINIDKLITTFGGDFSNETKIYVISDDVNNNITFKSIFDELTKTMAPESNYVFKSISNKDIKEEIEDTKDIVLEINSDENEIIKASITTFDVMDNTELQLFMTSLTTLKSNLALSSSGIGDKELKNLTEPISINQITTNPDLDEDSVAKENLSSILIVVFIIPFFFLVILLVQMVGAEINDEKTTKSMEIIISNVSPKTHFLSKILAGTTFVVSQGILLLLYVGLGLLIRMFLLNNVGSTVNDFTNMIKEIFDMFVNSGVLALLGKASILIALLFLFNFVAYGLIAGILASMTTSVEDYQQLQMPLMILLMVGYYIALMASVFNGSIFIKIVSCLPLLSPMIAPVLFLLGQTNLIELSISVLTSFALCFILIRYGLRIYKVGILNYSSKDLWKKIFKSIKNKSL